jgi:hypothetical protein
MAVEQRKGLVAEAMRAEYELQQALQSLRAFLDVGNADCDVAPEHRQAAKLYLESWVLGPVQEAVAFLRDEHACVKCGCNYSLRKLNGGFCQGCLRA